MQQEGVEIRQILGLKIDAGREVLSDRDGPSSGGLS